MDLPIKALNCESGYFLMVDISEAIPHIPAKYTDSHDFEELAEGEVPIQKNKVFMQDGTVPKDLAFCRWMAVERKVIMMPNSLFYKQDSPYKIDKYVRLAICKGMDHSIKAIERLRGNKQE